MCGGSVDRESAGLRTARRWSWALASKVAAFGIEPLIALLRVPLAMAVLLTMKIDADQPVGPLYAGVGLYLVFTGWVAWRALAGRAGAGLQLATHVLDLGAFSALLLVKGGPDSPFFVCFGFALLSGTLRWGLPGAVGTAGTALLLFGTIALAEWHRGGDAELDRLVLRASFLVIGGVMLAYLGTRNTAPMRLAAPGLAYRFTSLPASEQLIAWARFGLAVAAAIAAWVDPRGASVLTIVAIYAGYAGGLALFIQRHPLPGPWFTGGTHLADIAVITMLMGLTGGAASPFFVAFTFLILVGTLRWSWRGAIATAGILLFLFIFLWLGQPDRSLAQDRLVMWIAFLIIAGAMLGYLGMVWEQRTSQAANYIGSKGFAGRVADLSEWLQEACTVLRAKSALAIWTSSDDARQLAFWSGTLRQEILPRDRFGELVSDQLRDATFVCSGKGGCAIVGFGRARVEAPVVDPDLEHEFGLTSFATAPLQGRLSQGRLFVLGISGLSEDQLWAFELIAARLAVELDMQAVNRRAAEAARAAERVRLARDLHDGVLQGLTAISLQLKAFTSHLGEDAAPKLEEIRRQIGEEQRRLRSYVEETRAAPAEFALHDELVAFTSALARQWQSDIRLSVEPTDAIVARPLGHELKHLIAECVANATRHGQAKAVEIDVRRRQGEIALVIKDDGSGLPEHAGTYDRRSLASLGIGPRSVVERVRGLDGSLTLLTSPKGVTISIDLPLT
jgi:signal transduction histidine kinase